MKYSIIIRVQRLAFLLAQFLIFAESLEKRKNAGTAKKNDDGVSESNNEIEDIDWDLLFYIYCIEMGRTQEEFYHSSYNQITKMIDIYEDRKMAEQALMQNEYYESKYFGKSQVTEITSMSQIEGW